jgi:hypothetical protein
MAVRTANTIQTTFMIHREARAFLDSLVAGKYGHGQVISQLLLAEKVRRETREEVKREIRTGLANVLD